jgi:predicted short-subunit dehydrogenase-like oxidoreductase (DUF2520 family)
MKIGIIGAGKLAEKFALHCLSKRIDIVFITNRNQERGENLCRLLNEQLSVTTYPHVVFFSLFDPYPSVDLIFICTSDDSILEIARNFPNNECLVSVSGNLDFVGELPQFNTAVFYPYMSFSNNMTTSFEEIPCFIEAKNLSTIQLLNKFSAWINVETELISAEQRKKLHIAAVFANNFVNHLINIAETFLKNNNLDKSHIYPLLKETVSRLQNQSAFDSQSGPALRRDYKTMENHLNLLSEENKTLYQVISKSIEKLHSNQKPMSTL